MTTRTIIGEYKVRENDDYLEAPIMLMTTGDSDGRLYIVVKNGPDIGIDIPDLMRFISECMKESGD